MPALRQTAAPTALLLLLSLLAPGCLKMEHELRLERDGSLRYELDYAISEQAITQFSAAERIAGDIAAIATSPQPPPQHPILLAFQNPREAEIRTAIERYQAAGLHIESIRVDTRNAWRRVQLVVTCRDLPALAKTDFFQVHGFELTRGEQHVTFSRRPHLRESGTPPPLDQTTIRQITPLLEGFKTTVRLVVPGKIIRSSAFKTIRGTASWNFDFDADPEALRTLQRQPFRVEFESSRPLPEIRYAGQNYVSPVTRNPSHPLPRSPTTNN